MALAIAEKGEGFEPLKKVLDKQRVRAYIVSMPSLHNAYKTNTDENVRFFLVELSKRIFPIFHFERLGFFIF